MLILCYLFVFLELLEHLELDGVDKFGRLSFDRAFAFVCAIMWRDGDGGLSIDSETATNEGSITFLKWVM